MAADIEARAKVRRRYASQKGLLYVVHLRRSNTTACLSDSRHLRSCLGCDEICVPHFFTS